MGLEAYRIKLELVHQVKRQEIINNLTKLGFTISGGDLSDIYIEKAYEFGYIELALQNSELSRISLNEYILKHGQIDEIDTQPAEDKERISIQIAKPNHENIIDYLIKDLIELNKSIPILVLNLQTKEKVNLQNYDNLKEHFKNARFEFSQWFPNIKFPIRCRDVFKPH